MDRRRIELQIRAVIVTYRIEQRRLDARTMEEFRERASMLLHALEEEVRPHADLQVALADACREVDTGDATQGILIASDPDMRAASRSVPDGLADHRFAPGDREP